MGLLRSHQGIGDNPEVSTSRSLHCHEAGMEGLRHLADTGAVVEGEAAAKAEREEGATLPSPFLLH